MTIKYDMQKYERRWGESTILAMSLSNDPGAMSRGPFLLQVKYGFVKSIEFRVVKNKLDFR